MQYGHACVATVEMKVRVKVGTGRKIGLLPFSGFCAQQPTAMVMPRLQKQFPFPRLYFSLFQIIGESLYLDSTSKATIYKIGKIASFLKLILPFKIFYCNIGTTLHNRLAKL